MKLTEWVASFIEYKNPNAGDIRVVENEIIVRNGSEKKYFCFEKLNSFPEGVVLTLNSLENVEKVLVNWEEAINNKTTFFFVNPRINEYWALNPFNHSKVVDKKNLKQSVKSLFETVEEV